MQEQDISNAVKAMLNLPVWKDIEVYLEIQREAILAKGKKARNDSKKIEMWAELEGFDKCRQIFYKLADYHKKAEIKVNQEE